VHEAYHLWTSISNDDIKTAESVFKRLWNEKLAIIEKGLYSIETLRSKLWNELDFDALRAKEVYATLSDAGTADDSLLGLFKGGYRHYIRKDSKAVYRRLSDAKKNDEIVDQVLASCSIPIVFPSVKSNDRQYYDGGLFDNVPVTPLIEAGCDTIIVIHLHLHHFFDKNKYPNTRIIEINHAHSLGGLLNFDPNHTESCFQLGYSDATALFEKIELPL
jgi:NTE family protein